MRRALPAALLLALASLGIAAYPVYFKEQYYRLFHQHYAQAPDDAIENIFWLERAKKADFCNPLYALAAVPDKARWERYRYLLDMHIDLKLIEQHLALGSKFDKRAAYFYNAPWRDENLESLATAETAYKAALAYWKEAKELAGKAMRSRFLQIEGAEHWVGEAARIESGELDYAEIVQRQLDRVAKVRAEFQAMDVKTY